MKRVLAVAVLVVGLIAGATMAEAAIKKGTFTGKTNAKDPVGLKVNRSGKVYAFYYESVRLTCTDGDAFDSPSGSNRIQTPNDVLFKVNSKRKFAITARNQQTGFGWDATGKFNSKGTKVTGTLSVHAKFNEQNEQDPNGSVNCTSQDLTFSLARKVPLRQQG
jgi:opacity protein-like surface antigen